MVSADFMFVIGVLLLFHVHHCFSYVGRLFLWNVYQWKVNISVKIFLIFINIDRDNAHTLVRFSFVYKKAIGCFPNLNI